MCLTSATRKEDERFEAVQDAMAIDEEIRETGTSAWDERAREILENKKEKL